MTLRSSQYEHIRIEVQDDGYGMTQEYLKSVFDAFTRAENSTTNKVQGTGLGMAITKNIVELMGGTIDVSSEVDKGSLFQVELELRIPKEQEYRQFWEKSGISRVLAVCGNVESAKTIQMLLNDVGVIVHTAAGMQEALSLAGDNDNYHVVLLDCDTVQSSLLQVAEKLREVFPHEIPVLFLATHDFEDIENTLAMDNMGVLSKPFFISAFQEKLLELQGCGDSEVKQEPKETDNLSGLHFLVAEDNEINAEILHEILLIEEADCEIVENGKLAVERFAVAKEGEFDAILMDVQMPVMNGYDATRAIRALERSDARTIPIIAMTANAFAEDEKEALNAGMDIHLAKPVDIALLKKIIKQCVHREED